MQVDPVRIKRRTSRRFRKVIAKSLSDEAILAPSFRDGASASGPESRDSGFVASHRTGMTVLREFENQRVDRQRGAGGGVNFLHGAVAFGAQAGLPPPPL